MSTSKTEQPSQQISQEKLLAFVRTVIGGSRGREDDEHPLPPGPWDPHIRIALEQINAFGPHPEPWNIFGPGPQPWLTRESGFVWKIALAHLLAVRPEINDAIGSGHSLIDKVALNPQPLPPRFAFLVVLARTVISRAELIQEIADATSQQGEQQGIIIVGGYTRQFSDDFCGTDFKPRWPFPGPPPPWFANKLDSFDLMVMATQFDHASKEAFSPVLRQSLADVTARLVESGLSRMQ